MIKNAKIRRCILRHSKLEMSYVCTLCVYIMFLLCGKKCLFTCVYIYICIISTYSICACVRKSMNQPNLIKFEDNDATKVLQFNLWDQILQQALMPTSMARNHHMILLMVKKSGDHQLRLVGFIPLFTGFYAFQVVGHLGFLVAINRWVWPPSQRQLGIHAWRGASVKTPSSGGWR